MGTPDAPFPVMTRMIDDPARGIETKICVFDMAYGHPLVVDFTAQVYRRRGGVGEFELVHTTDSCNSEFKAMEEARTWHRRFPARLVLSNKNGEKL